MSLKSIVKKYCPLPLQKQLRYMKLAGHILVDPLRKIRARRIITKAEKYLPYYQDDLSREILRSMEEYVMTQDEKIFFMMSLKEGWKNHSFIID